MLEVMKAGPLATIQDRGRPGHAHLGIPHAGALDPVSLDRANALAGNSCAAAGLELASGRFVARFHIDGIYAVAGAVSVAPTSVRAGETVEIGGSVAGMFSYLAVHGGIDVPAVLGSRSTDTLSGIGPAVLRRGSLLPLGTLFADRLVPPALEMPAGEIRVRVRPGPRASWFAQTLSGGYSVSTLNRIGARLTGPPLTRTVTRELPSEGLVAGAVQVPPDGQPIVFLADHPTTGGYPVIAVVHPEDLPLIAQCRPSTRVVFYGP